MPQSTLLSFFGAASTPAQKSKGDKTDEKQKCTISSDAASTPEVTPSSATLHLSQAALDVSPRKVFSSPVTSDTRVKRQSAKPKRAAARAPLDKPMSKRRRVVESDDSDGDSDVCEGLDTEESPLQDSGTPKEPDCEDDIRDQMPCQMPDLEAYANGQPPVPNMPSAKRLKELTKPGSLEHTEKSASKQSRFEAMNQERYRWLLDVRDMQGRAKGEPGYDCRTLHIPASAWKKFTTFESQYWKIKQHQYDVVLFTKKGKFYECFEDDADVCSKELGLKMTDRVNMRMAGVPESSFQKFAAALVSQGYKVGRVEQMETMNMMTSRTKSAPANAKGSAKSNVCQRELCEVISKGTVTDEALLPGADANLLLVIKEEEKPQGASYGLCLMDAASSKVWLVQAEDDENRSFLETVLLRHRPVEVLWSVTRTGAACVSKCTQKLVSAHLHKPQITSIAEGEEFVDANAAMEQTIAGDYFKEGEIPEVLQACFDKKPLAASAWGAALWYMKHLLLDSKLVPGARFDDYGNLQHSAYMQLDGQALANLDILENSGGGTQGTLLGLLDRCCTPFGRRMLRHWLCSPLNVPSDIEARLDTIEYLHTNRDFVEEAMSYMRELPDLERMLSRVQAEARKKIHGVMFNGAVQKGVENLLNIMDNTQKLVKACRRINKSLDRELPGVDLDINEVEGILSEFKGKFDVKLARDQFVVEPEKGENSKYDAVKENLQEVLSKMNQSLNTFKSKYGCPAAKFWSANFGKEPFQIEVPMEWLAKHKLPSSVMLMSQTKTVKRFWTPDIKDLVFDYTQANESVQAMQQDVIRGILAWYADQTEAITQIVSSVASLDCLVSLSSTISLGGHTCRPTFMKQNGSEGTEIHFKQLWHPCVNVRGGSFIPNDVDIGGDDANAFLLTGPNMGGKSTLMRQVCLGVILAHLGAYVPAIEAKMTVVDRLFTRIGAMDRIQAGQSTFLVEMIESSNILKHATNRSLVILDELGRGSSTIDGYAIAHAVLSKLLERQCACFFSTHYHNLVLDVPHNKAKPMRMAAKLDLQGRVVFLYKLEYGWSGRSFGVECAQAAGLPSDVLQRASLKAFEMAVSTHSEVGTKMRELVTEFCAVDDALEAGGNVEEAHSRARSIQQALCHEANNLPV